MTKLFVGNTKKQHEDFHFRLPENGKLINLPIAAGTQIQVLDDLDESTIDAIVKQHERYGLIAEKEAKRAKNFVGLVYSLDAPIKLQSLQLVFAHNKEVLEEKAQQNLETVGAATKEKLDGISREGEGSGLPRVEVEIREEAKEGQNATIAKGVEVVKEGVAPTKGKGK